MKHGTEQETAMQHLYIPALSFQGRPLMDPNGEHEKERVPLRNAATFVIDGKDMVEVNKFGLLL